VKQEQGEVCVVEPDRVIEAVTLKVKNVPLLSRLVALA
jgi:hypothetical protein